MLMGELEVNFVFNDYYVALSILIRQSRSIGPAVDLTGQFRRPVMRSLDAVGFDFVVSYWRVRITDTSSTSTFLGMEFTVGVELVALGGYVARADSSGICFVDYGTP